MYSPLASDHIRLLDVSLDELGKLKIGLLVQHIDERRFEALSYTWAAPLCTAECEQEYGPDHDVVVSITVDGEAHQRAITRNLYEALDAIVKYNSRSHRIWVDAICINQQDLTEKAQQVAYMWEIYRRAAVIVWLGADDGTLDLVAHVHTETVTKFCKLNDTVDAVDLRKFGDGGSIVWGDHLIDVTADECRALARFYATRRWINRAWIFQEVLGEAVWVLMNGTMIPFHHFAIFADMLNGKPAITFRNTPTPNQSLGQGSEFSMIQQCRTVMRTGMDNLLSEHDPEQAYFAAMLSFLRYPRVATDIRDVIYSVHSAAASIAGVSPITVDYTATDVFHTFTTAALKHSLEVLSFCQGSWIPDFRSSPWRPKHIVGRPWPITPRTSLPTIEGDLLHLDAMLVSKIKDVHRSSMPAVPNQVDIYEQNIGPLEFFLRNSTDLNQYVRAAEMSCEQDDAVHLAKLLAEHSQEEIDESVGYFSGYRGPKDYNRLAKNGIICELIAITENPHCPKELVDPIEAAYLDIASQLPGFTEEEIDNAKFWSKRYNVLANTPHRPGSPWDQEIRRMESWRFSRYNARRVAYWEHGSHIYITENGLFGRTKSEIEPDDELWLLCGARIPYILRREGEHYRLVTSSFVPYAMHGELLQDESPCRAGAIERITLVR